MKNNIKYIYIALFIIIYTEENYQILLTDYLCPIAFSLVLKEAYQDKNSFDFFSILILISLLIYIYYSSILI
jgi:hypothetical protein